MDELTRMTIARLTTPRLRELLTNNDEIPDDELEMIGNELDLREGNYDPPGRFTRGPEPASMTDR